MTVTNSDPTEHVRVLLQYADGLEMIATELLAFVDEVHGGRNHRASAFLDTDGSQWCVTCPAGIGVWPCPVERARRWATEQEDAT